MKLEEIRQRGIDERLKERRTRLSLDVMPALVVTVLSGVLALSVWMDPADWAKGDWFKPGGLLYDAFGMAGAVAVTRLALGLLFVASGAYLCRLVYRLRGGGERRRIAAEFRVFDPPEGR
jgi:hypothetical protein